MDRLDPVLAAHPAPAHSKRAVAEECITACSECAAICTSCADACLAEDKVSHLVTCIRLNLDCADICDVTGRLFVRPTERHEETLRHQLEACIAICRACGEECGRHRQMDHCRICAESCRRCASACQRMLEALVP